MLILPHSDYRWFAFLLRDRYNERTSFIMELVRWLVNEFPPIPIL
jgi:hypothetical protein